MFLKQEATIILNQLNNVVKQISTIDYTKKIDIIGGATIGEHTRHVIELFQQLIVGYSIGMINYDQRKRDFNLQQDVEFASNVISELINKIGLDNKDLILTSMYDKDSVQIMTNFDRELLYNIEHCIHHQALIKVALIYLNLNIYDSNFGIAKSTIKYKKQCAQ